MKIQRFLCLMLAATLFTGCSEEKKNTPPLGANPGPAAKPTDMAQSDGKKATADVTGAFSSDGKKATADETKAAKPENKKATPDELLAKARQALARQDSGTAIAASEEMLAADPKNRDGLFLLSAALQLKGAAAIRGGNTMAASETLLKSAKYIKQLRAAYPKLTKEDATELPVILYNEACILALTGETDKAMAALEDACDSGFADAKLLNTDPDLDKLRSLPRFKAFLPSVLAKMAAKAKEQIRELMAAQKPFDFNFSLPDVDGKTVALKDFNGKILIADIWGTWCPPCRQEIPHFVALVKKYEDRGLRMVGINYENGDPATVSKLIREFAEANKINYPCVIGDDKTRNQVPNFRGYPTTVFLDRTGKVRLCLVGARPPSDLEAIILELLDEKTASLK